MPDAIEKARRFLDKEQVFRLGELLTESSHPKTRALSETIGADLCAGIRMLQSVDEEISPVAARVFQEDTFCELIEAFVRALNSGRRIFFTGCGATGRLSILLEAAWRRFWRQLKDKYADLAAIAPDVENSTFSVMAGGDFALIKAVEGFEDFPQFGRYQLEQAGVQTGDVVVAITEGGETPFVIGTAWQGLDAGAQVFFVYNNPTEVLVRHVERSRQVIEEPRIKKLDLATGPMAITGSTRMQAVTIELLVVGCALEIAVMRLLDQEWTARDRARLGIHMRLAEDYYHQFANLLAQLSDPSAMDAMAELAQFEESIYHQGGLITYVADSALLDALTDTTERSPTFMVPPFRKYGDDRSPQSWAFVKNPFLTTRQAWTDMLQREPRGLDWHPEVYRQLDAPSILQTGPPKLDNAEILRFTIGNEPDPSRANTPGSALVAIAVGDQADDLVRSGLERFGSGYKKTAAIIIGGPATTSPTNDLFQFSCDLPDSPLQLWHHLAAKLVLNTISTATMVRMGRVVSNAMVWLSPSNKKLIDRGSRLISQVANCGYEQACVALHQAMEEVQLRSQRAEEVPSPVALAIERIVAERGES